MERRVQVAHREDKSQILGFLQKEGQLLLPVLELVETSRIALDEIIDVTGRAMIECLLHLSAEGVAGQKQRGKVGGEVRWHGKQPGVVNLSDRRVRVTRPRLRRREGGAGAEVEIPAYGAMRELEVGQRMLEILLRGVSTRAYAKVLPAMAETVGISRSSVSRQAILASEASLKKFHERRWDEVDLLVIYIDGIVVGDYYVIVSIGVDRGGHKHVLGLREGATENAVVVKELLEELVERGVAPDRRRLFVIDGSKALRKAINEVFGSKNPVQRCRIHKMQNVLSYLPEEERERTRWMLNAAWKCDAQKGIAKLKQHAKWLEKSYPSASASLLEGLEEMFTVQRLGLSSSLRRCLSSTNLIENPHSGMRQRTRNVKRWRDGKMVLRWLASAYLATEKAFRRIQGYKDLWMLEAALRHDKKRDISEEAA